MRREMTICEGRRTWRGRERRREERDEMEN